MKKYYNYKFEEQDTPVEFNGTAKKYEKFIKDNDHLVGSEVTKTEFDKIKPKKYHDIKEYIFALMKQANQDRLGGKDLIQDLDDALGKFLQVDK